jgi:seryl-tRNA synthetase
VLTRGQFGIVALGQGHFAEFMTYDLSRLYDGLVEHGLIIPVGVDGAVGRGAVFEEVLGRFDALVLRLSPDEPAESMTFPPVINRTILERVHYLDSFPHLCGAIHSFSGSELESKLLARKASAGEDWGPMLSMTALALNPAACYPVYPTLRGTVSAGGRLITMMNWVFRHEPSPEPTRMQAFRVREMVRVGTREQVLLWRDAWLERAVSVLSALGLPAKADVASDPFFGRGGQILGRSQKEQRLKFEVLVPVISETDPTALCSFNFHQEHFGATFGIHQPDGSVANTACLGFGLERATMALFQTHGFKPDEWPAAVRALLWP